MQGQGEMVLAKSQWRATYPSLACIPRPVVTEPFAPVYLEIGPRRGRNDVERSLRSAIGRSTEVLTAAGDRRSSQLSGF
jgi:hypothetical protein